MASTAEDSDLPSLSSPVPRFQTVKGTKMGYRNFLPAEISHWQPPQQENIDTMRQQCVVPLPS